MAERRESRRAQRANIASKDVSTMTEAEMRAVGYWPPQPELEGDDVVITGFKIPGFDKLPDFDIRNGDPSDARSLLVRPTIPDGFHWVPISGLMPEDALDAVDGHILSARHQLAQHPPRNMTATQMKKAAIVIGTSRAVMTKHYRLTESDFIGGELAAPVLNAKKDEVISYKVVAALGNEQRRAIQATMELDDTDRAAISALLSSAIGALPVQGYSLMMTGHHYISEPGSPSRRAFAVIEKQFWNSADVKAWFASDLEIIQDCAWHKSGHPVIMNMKHDLACDERVATMLREAGAGSAASRLPALEPALRTAGSYLALMNAVDPLFRMFGGNADAYELGEMVRIIKDWPREGGQVKIPDYWPEDVVDRKTALEWLTAMLARNAPRVAYCYGFYSQLTEQNQTMSGGAGTDTLRTSHSLSKLSSQCHATFVEGVLSYADFAAARNRKRMEGKYEGATMPFAITQ